MYKHLPGSGVSWYQSRQMFSRHVSRSFSSMHVPAACAPRCSSWVFKSSQLVGESSVGGDGWTVVVGEGLTPPQSDDHHVCGCD